VINSTGVVAFIHAKGSSERVESKNKQLVGGLPLYVNAIRRAQQARLVDAVVIDSDCDEILTIGEREGAIPLKRPDELATNATAGDGLESWAADNAPHSEAIAVVICTSPFLHPDSIDRAISLLRVSGRDSVAAVRTTKLFRWEDGKPAYGDLRTSQSLPPTTYETTGLYIVRTAYALQHRRRMNYENCIPCEVPLLESIDIDTEEDLKLARIISIGLFDE